MIYYAGICGKNPSIEAANGLKWPSVCPDRLGKLKPRVCKVNVCGSHGFVDLSSTMALLVHQPLFPNFEGRDYTLSFPDEFLSGIFCCLSLFDRQSCSLVCKRWFDVERSSRQQLSLFSCSDISMAIPGIFNRFDNLRELKLRSCRKLSYQAIEEFAKRCSNLKKLSCVSCNFGAKGMNAILKYCVELEELYVEKLGRWEAIGPFGCVKLRKIYLGDLDNFTAKGMNAILKDCVELEELTVKRLRRLKAVIGPFGCVKLRKICLEELDNGQYFGPLISGSKNLETLKLSHCAGDWDELIERITDNVAGLVEVQLETLQVSDRALRAVSRCVKLEVLHSVNCFESTNVGIVAIANGCKNLKELNIVDEWNNYQIGDSGLSAVARRCQNLQELVLLGLNPSAVSLALLASNCQGLKRLALCESETIGDQEIALFAGNWSSLKELYIMSCPVSVMGIEALLSGYFQQLVLTELEYSLVRLVLLAPSCQTMEKLTLWRWKTIGDKEIAWIAESGSSLKEVDIGENCSSLVSVLATEALYRESPKFKKVEVMNCTRVTSEGLERLNAYFKSLSNESHGSYYSYCGMANLCL